jgi:DNA polymerase-4
MQRAIMHMDLDSFFVSVERLRDPGLIGKPVLVGGTSDRGVVASCSYEARAFGIHSAMPMRRARQLCPEAICVRGDSEQYSKYSNEVTEIIHHHVPLYEKTSIDEFYVDMSGMDKFFGTYKLATDIRQKIMKDTRLPISFALSTNKTVAKIGTGEAKPNGQMEIPAGTEKSFLAPMPLSKIPGVGEKTTELLKGMGLVWIHQVQAMKKEAVERALGLNGGFIWEKANGIDDSPIIPYSERKSISSERTFEKDTTDVKKLKTVLLSMSENLAYQLRQEEHLTACVAVKIRYSDFSTHSMQMKIPYTSLDHTLIEKVKELFDKLYDKQLHIRLIGVRFSHLVQGSYQYNLFEDSCKQLLLYQAMDKMRVKYNDGSIIQKAAGMEIHHHDFNPFGGGKKSIEKEAEAYLKQKENNLRKAAEDPQDYGDIDS